MRGLGAVLGLPAPPPAKTGEADHDDQERDIAVAADPEEPEVGVGSDQLGGEAQHAVADDVHEHEGAPCEHLPPTDREQHGDDEQVADHLVQERRVDGRHDLPAALDLQRPRQRGGRAEQLLVEVVAQPPEDLGQGDAGRYRVGEVGHGPAPAPDQHDRGDRAEQQPAEEGQAALPDPEDPKHIVEQEPVQVRRNVRQPRPDEAHPHGPDAHPIGELRVAAKGGVASAEERDRGDDADRDRDAVVVDGERAQLQDVARRRGDGGEDRHAGHPRAATGRGRLASTSPASGDAVSCG